MRYRIIAPSRIKGKRVIEIEKSAISEEELKRLNEEEEYNIYFFPNYCSKPLSQPMKGKDVDVFNWVFVDMDLKDNIYKSKEEFLETLKTFKQPTKVIDSGNGIHVYWYINNLEAVTYLRIQKSLISKFKTDKSIWTLMQLMRVPGYYNTKAADFKEWKLATVLEDNDVEYNVGDFLADFPPLTKEDEVSITNHLNEHVFQNNIKETIKNEHYEIPDKSRKVLEENPRIKELFLTPEDRSIADMKLANILQKSAYTKEETLSIISNGLKAQDPKTSKDYAERLVNKVYETPLKPLDLDYEECKAIADKEFLKKTKQDVIVEYKLEKEYKKTLKEIEADKRKGVYTLKNTEEIRKNSYISDIRLLKETIAKRLYCISPELTKKVPLLGVELVLIAAESGTGKTTLATNIVEPLLAQRKKVLFISNEERGSDIAMRIAALRKGWNINDRYTWDANSPIWTELEEECATIATSPDFTIVDNYISGTDLNDGREIDPLDLTNLDHLKALLESVERDGIKYDLLVLDYISKIGTSDDKEPEWQVLYKTIKFIEEWIKKNKLPAIVFTQLKEQGKEKEEKQQFQTRLPGSKRILNAVTTAIEIVTDFNAAETTWIWHKFRYGEKYRHTLKFYKGRFFDIVDNSVDEGE